MFEMNPCNNLESESNPRTVVHIFSLYSWNKSACRARLLSDVHESSQRVGSVVLFYFWFLFRGFEKDVIFSSLFVTA